MRKIFKILLLIFYFLSIHYLLFTIHCLYAAGEPAVFLQGGAGARALGMGGAFTALSDDATSCYWNPANLGILENVEFTAMYADLKLDTLYNYLGLVLPLPIGTLGGGWIQETSDNLEKTDANGQSLGLADMKNNAFLISYGLEIAYPLSLGITAKIINEQIATYQATSLAIDTGLLLDLGSLAIGLNIQNINSPKLEGDSYWNKSQKVSETIPMNIKFGLSYRTKQMLTIGQQKTLTAPTPAPAAEEVIENTEEIFDIEGYEFQEQWIPQPPPAEVQSSVAGEAGQLAAFKIPLETNWALDFNFAPEGSQAVEISPGIECWFNKKYALRLGWHLADFKHSYSVLHRFSVGASIILGFLQFDYAYIMHDDLYNTHRISTSFLF